MNDDEQTPSTDPMSPPDEERKPLPVVLGLVLFCVSIALFVSTFVRRATEEDGIAPFTVTPPRSTATGVPALQPSQATGAVTVAVVLPALQSGAALTSTAVVSPTVPPVPSATPTVTSPTPSRAPTLMPSATPSARLSPTATPTPEPTLRRPTRVPRPPIPTLTPTRR